METPVNNTVEVCFTPKLYQEKLTGGDFVVVVTDILRATTSICMAFANGVEKIIPVEDSREAMKYRDRGFPVAAEKDGIKLDFADFGNDPREFTREKIGGKTLVFCTTNGTRAIETAGDASGIVIGSFLNLNAVRNWLVMQEKNAVILCAGWKDRFGLEDAVFAGALAESLTDTKRFSTACDSAKAAIDLWGLARNDIPQYIGKTSHAIRLGKIGPDTGYRECLAFNQTDLVPLLKNHEISL